MENRLLFALGYVFFPFFVLFKGSLSLLADAVANGGLDEGPRRKMVLLPVPFRFQVCSWEGNEGASIKLHNSASGEVLLLLDLPGGLHGKIRIQICLLCLRFQKMNQVWTWEAFPDGTGWLVALVNFLQGKPKGDRYVYFFPDSLFSTQVSESSLEHGGPFARNASSAACSSAGCVCFFLFRELQT